MLSKESYILAKLLGRDDPKVKSLVWAASNPRMQQTVQNLLEGLARSKGWDPQNPPRFGLPVGLSKSDYLLGRAKCGTTLGEEVGVSDEDLLGNIGIFGASHVGKSTMVKILLLEFTKGPQARPGNTFAALDMDSEYRDLLPFFTPDELVWLTRDDLGINPFAIPTDADGRRVMPPDKWIGHLKEWLRLCWLNDPSVNLFAEVLTTLYIQRGVFHGTDDYPSLSDVILALKRESPPHGSDRARARDKVLDRLSAIRSMLSGLNVRRSRNIHDLFGRRSVILDLSETADLSIPLLFNLLVLLFKYSFGHPPGEPPHRILDLEEAQNYLGGQTRKRVADVRESQGLAVLRSLRKAGFCGCVVSQLLSDLDPAVVGNLSSVFCLRLVQNRCIAQAGSALGLDPWQQRELALLPAKEAIMRVSRHPEAIHLAIKDVGGGAFDLRNVMSREEAKARSKPVLDSIPFVPGPDPDRGHVSALQATAAISVKGVRQPGAEADEKPRIPAWFNSDARRLLEGYAGKPFLTSEEMAAETGLSLATVYATRQTLVNYGLIEEGGQFANRRKLHLPTGKGRQWCRALGITVHRYKSGIEHEACLRGLTESILQTSPWIAPCKPFAVGGVQPDGILGLPDGGRLAIQACCSKNYAREAANLVKLCNTEGINKVVLCGKDKAHTEGVRRAVKKKCNRKIPEHLIYVTAEQCISNKLDWKALLQFDL